MASRHRFAIWSDQIQLRAELFSVSLGENEKGRKILWAIGVVTMGLQSFINRINAWEVANKILENGHRLSNSIVSLEMFSRGMAEIKEREDEKQKKHVSEMSKHPDVQAKIKEFISPALDGFKEHCSVDLHLNS